MKKAKRGGFLADGKKRTTNNAKAFTFKSHMKAAANVRRYGFLSFVCSTIVPSGFYSPWFFFRAADLSERKKHIPLIDRSPVLAPPIVVAIVGPSKVDSISNGCFL